MKKRTKIIALSLLLSASFASAQDQLFVKNEDTVKSVAENAAKKRAKDDQVKQDFYQCVITNAFNEYFKDPICSSVYNTGSKVALKEIKKELSKNQKEKAKELKEIEKNSTKNDGDYEKIKKEIENLQKQRKEDRSASLRSEQEIKSLQEEYNTQKPLLEDIEMAENKMNEIKEGFQATADEVMNLKVPATLLNNKDEWKTITSTLSSFEEKRSGMRTIDSNLEVKTSKQAEKLYKYKKLVGFLEQAVKQMGSNYNKRKNEALIDSINSSMTRVSLSQEQRKECDTVVSALANQEKTYQYIKSFLQKIPGEFGLISNQKSMAEFKNWKNKKLRNDGYDTNYKNNYYTNFNVVIGKLDKLPLSPSTDALKKQINGLINEL